MARRDAAFASACSSSCSCARSCSSRCPRRSRTGRGVRRRAMGVHNDMLRVAQRSRRQPRACARRLPAQRIHGDVGPGAHRGVARVARACRGVGDALRRPGARTPPAWMCDRVAWAGGSSGRSARPGGGARPGRRSRWHRRRRGSPGFAGRPCDGAGRRRDAEAVPRFIAERGQAWPVPRRDTVAAQPREASPAGGRCATARPMAGGILIRRCPDGRRFQRRRIPRCRPDGRRLQRWAVSAAADSAVPPRWAAGSAVAAFRGAASAAAGSAAAAMAWGGGGGGHMGGGGGGGHR